ncbi:MAG TPA: hypothetical protein PK594_16955, partial [Mycobacterium sp.]|nr:hypothetical protein [Mycobacterium sp.]
VTLAGCGGSGSNAASGDGPGGATSNASIAGEVSMPNPTLQNLTLEWAFTGDANANAEVTLRYRVAGASSWSTGAPLRRIAAGSTGGFSWATRHSGSVFDLQPGTRYEVELSLMDPDGGSTTRTVTVATRAEPQPLAGGTVKVVTPATFDAVMAGAQPGDILELGAGTYASPTVDQDGTAARPLVIRAAASAAAGSVIVSGDLSLIGRQYVQLRGLTVNGRIRINQSLGVAVVGNTVNAQTSVDNGNGIVMLSPSEDCFIADNTVIGTTAWNEAALGVAGANRGEGILVNGPGHVVMNNRVRGFRDGISTTELSEASRQYSIDILNNDISETADDAIEADYCAHNCRVMRNRITNTFTGMSSQPGLGGPTWFIRNVVYNAAYVAFKLYNGSHGDVLLHNTVVKNGDAFSSYPGVPIYGLYSRNNLFIGGPAGTWGGYSSGTGRVINLADLDVASASLDYDALGSTLGSFNGWFGATTKTATLAELRAQTTEKNAVQVGLDVFAATITFPAAAMTTFAAPDLRLRAGGAAIDVGQVLPGFKDGFAGAAPDAGAYELGAALPVYGPRP